MSDKEKELDEREKAVKEFDERLDKLREEAKNIEPKEVFQTSLSTSFTGQVHEGSIYNYLVPIDCTLKGFGAMLSGTIPESLKIVIKRTLSSSVKTDSFVLKSGLNEVTEDIFLKKGSMLSLVISSSEIFSIEDFHITLIIEAKNARI